MKGNPGLGQRVFCPLKCCSGVIMSRAHYGFIKVRWDTSKETRNVSIKDLKRGPEPFLDILRGLISEHEIQSR